MGFLKGGKRKKTNRGPLSDTEGIFRTPSEVLQWARTMQNWLVTASSRSSHEKCWTTLKDLIHESCHLIYASFSWHPAKSYHMQASSPWGRLWRTPAIQGSVVAPGTPFSSTIADGDQHSDLCNLNVCVYCALWAHSLPAQHREEGLQRAAWLKCAWYFSKYTAEAFRLVEEWCWC